MRNFLSSTKSISAALWLLTVLAAVWWPGLRSAISPLDLLALLSIPFLISVLAFGLAGRAALIMAAISAALVVYWASIATDWTAFAIVFGRLVEGAALFWMSAYFLSSPVSRPVKNLLQLAVASAVVGALVLPTITGEKGRYDFASLPLDPGPIQGGAVFALLAFLCLVFIDGEEAGKQRVRWVVLYGLCVALTVLTLSRIGTVAAIVTIPFLLLRVRWLSLVAAAAAGAIGLVYGALTTLTTSRPVETLVDAILGRAGAVGDGAVTRWDKWQPFLDTVRSSWMHMLFGTGPGSINASLPPHADSFFAADSQYVRSLFELGIVGSVAFHGIFALRLLMPFRRYQLSLYATFVVMIGVMFSTHEVLFVGKPMALIYLVGGALLGLALSGRREATPDVQKADRSG